VAQRRPLQGKEVCGILIEQRTTGSHLATVVGIGLNVNQPREFFEQAGLPFGGSLAERTGQTLPRGDIFQQLLASLDREYQRLLEGDVAGLEACWKWHLGWLGRTVALESHGDSAVLSGRLLDATFAAMEIVDAQGEKLSMAPERIKHIRNADIGMTTEC
jgi:BirA family biotin operon repressor/biotin-[acetyl-CoA-carboxylase] ligase